MRKGVTGKSGALGGLGNFYANCGRIRSGEACGTQHRELVEDLVIELGDEIILAIGFAAPDLPEFDSLYGQRTLLKMKGLTALRVRGQ